MNFLFRVDAGGPIGLGHYYRSLNLAQQLAQRGHQITFCFMGSDFWKAQLSAGFGFPAINLETAAAEAGMKQIIHQQHIDVFFVDGLIEFSKDFIQSVKERSTVVFYQNISNSAYFADIFILPSLHHREGFFDGFKPETKIYQGLEYFTFHPQVSKLQKHECASTVKSIAITAGGSDPKDTLRKLHAQIDYERFSDIQFTYFYGKDYLYIKDIPQDLAGHFRFEMFDHQKIVNNDLLLSAFGVSTYEFLALGMPVIAFGHQESNAFAAQVLAQKTNALISLGNIDEMNPDLLNDALFTYAFNLNKRKELVAHAAQILDFKGVSRIIDILEKIPNDRQ